MSYAYDRYLPCGAQRERHFAINLMLFVQCVAMLGGFHWGLMGVPLCEVCRFVDITTPLWPTRERRDAEGVFLYVPGG